MEVILWILVALFIVYMVYLMVRENAHPKGGETVVYRESTPSEVVALEAELPPTAPLPRRTILRVLPKDDGWVVQVDGEDEPLWHCATKANAVDSGVEEARARVPSQLVIHKRNGEFQSERTYGGDPRRRRG